MRDEVMVQITFDPRWANDPMATWRVVGTSNYVGGRQPHHVTVISGAVDDAHPQVVNLVPSSFSEWAVVVEGDPGLSMGTHKFFDPPKNGAVHVGFTGPFNSPVTEAMRKKRQASLAFQAFIDMRGGEE